MRIRLSSYNVLIPRVLTATHNWDDRKETLLENLPELGDIIALQEVDYFRQNQGQEISETLRENNFLGFEPNKLKRQYYPDEFHHRIPIFWNKDKFTLQSHNMIQLTQATPEKEAILPEIENRYCSHTSLKSKTSNQTVKVFNLHQQQIPDTLNPQEDAEQIKLYELNQFLGLKRLELFVKNECSSTDMIFIAGDYNTYNPTITGFNDAKHIAETVYGEEYNSYHAFKNPLPANYSDLDHIFTNTPVAKHETLVHVQGSDHHPIRVIIE